MSVIDNLRTISARGPGRFVKEEAKRWKCEECGAQLCVHKTECIECGAVWNDRENNANPLKK